MGDIQKELDDVQDKKLVDIQEEELIDSDNQVRFSLIYTSLIIQNIYFLIY